MTANVQTSGSFIPTTLDANGIGHGNFLLQEGFIIFYNQSIYGLQVIFADGENIYLPAGARRWFLLSKPSSQFTWVILNTANVPPLMAPLNIVTIETMDLSDTAPQADILSIMTSLTNPGALLDGAELNFGWGQNFTFVAGSASANIALTGTAPNQLASFVPGATAFLLIRDFLLESTQGRLTTRGNPETFLSQMLTLSIPANANLLQITQTFTGAMFLSGLAVQTIGSGVTINNIEVKRTQDPVGSFVAVVAAISQPTNSFVNIQSLFGPYGFTNYTSPYGIDVRFTVSNTNAGVRSLTFMVGLGILAMDDINATITYIPPQGAPPLLLCETINIRGDAIFLPLGKFSPIALPDVASTNYGTLSVHLLTGNGLSGNPFYFNPTGVGGALSCSVIYVNSSSITP